MILLISGFWWKIPLFLLINTVIFAEGFQKGLFLKEVSIREMNWYFSLEMKQNIVTNSIINFETFFTRICIEKTQTAKQLIFLYTNVWVTLT